jgi:non-specific serine/threonine protein kinase
MFGSFSDIQLDQVKDEDLIMRSTLERRTLYRSMRMAEPRYVSRFTYYSSSTGADTLGGLGCRIARLVCLNVLLDETKS